MRIAIIYGCRKNGSTHNCVKIIKESLDKLGTVEYDEIWLTKDLSKLCTGCVNCILRGEQYCPHHSSVNNILEKIIGADGIILATPVYGMNVSGAMKNFIDHFCYMWMPHRPNPKMFNKVAIIISTTAGAGTISTNKTMKKALDYMGVKKIYCYGKAVMASSWEDINEGKKQKMQDSLIALANKYYKSIENIEKIRTRVKTRLLFNFIRKMTRGLPDTNIDKQYWEKNGWYEKQKPYT